MFRSSLQIVFMLGLSLGCLAQAQAAPVSCTSANQPESWSRTLPEMVSASEQIVLAQAYSFEPQERSDGLDGVYTMAVLAELKGGPASGIRIAGLAPHDFLPQSYIDVTARHNAFAAGEVPFGFTSIIEGDTSCRLAPKFMLGYNYLIFIDLEHHAGQQPVHSPQLDQWFRSVVTEIERQAADP